MSFTDFPSFSELPTEIRLLIWRDAAYQALNPPRAIVQDPAVRPRDITLLETNPEACEEALLRKDLRTFRRSTPGEQGVNDSSPSWDWFSMKTGIFRHWNQPSHSKRTLW
ncbi:predicted protein [Sclerotinia sclerotiorum 1980 UF-70]|uniref:2EXR domain-containing protein n=2 Tax=Sclerotinia sclerotiorum (strain ATCC 18683 / 1980 / Ss-1) TaxID=665079 RepID=A7EQT8_SCLS1|nr:predicted protein [Sclerotinia sclerotiorum 1980 UF-70]APA13651.1 hypothetical protein sscle_11g084210 [Sclerotinia sclerotiorum 1980 UF-70]EDN91830.1 predicted protein [Sclerotinia sclerotiorum 1980 UF-70]